MVRAPDGFAVEHDAATGDVYLRPAVPQPGTAATEPSGSGAEGGAVPDPVTLFIGTERGFTYRLALTPTARDSAQVLIRNADAVPVTEPDVPVTGGDPHVAALVRLVRAVARREPLPGHEILAGGTGQGMRIVETGGVRGCRRSCWRRTPSPRLQAGAPRRASPGPCGIRWPEAVSRRSGWRVRARVLRAGGSPWLSLGTRSGRDAMSAQVGIRPGAAPVRDDGDAGAVRRRQLLLSLRDPRPCCWPAWPPGWARAAAGRARPRAARGRDRGAGRGREGLDAALRGAARRIETKLREMEREARSLRADNDRLAAKLEADAANAQDVIDTQAAMIDELQRQADQAGIAQGGASAGDQWFEDLPRAASRTGGPRRWRRSA